MHSSCLKDGIDTYKCSCVDGYYGDDCETDVDECSTDPCVHGECTVCNSRYDVCWMIEVTSFILINY